jgi:hypothetical protein
LPTSELVVEDNRPLIGKCPKGKKIKVGGTRAAMKEEQRRSAARTDTHPPHATTGNLYETLGCSPTSRG